MRWQETWCPDDLPVLGSRSFLFGWGMSGISTASQSNMVATIRRALAIGINHFETARAYGTSEMQFADALHSLVSSGEIKRSDFVLQTKIGSTLSTDACVHVCVCVCLCVRVCMCACAYPTALSIVITKISHTKKKERQKTKKQIFLVSVPPCCRL